MRMQGAGRRVPVTESSERKRLAQIREQISNEFLTRTPEAVDALMDIITDSEINPIARVQGIALILERGLGKPEENIRIRNSEEDADEAQKRLDKVFAQVAERLAE